MRTIVVGILYPGIEEFLSDYIDCINKQTTRNFEVFLFDNNFKYVEEFKKKFNEDIFIKIIPIEEKNSLIIPRRIFITEILMNEKNVENIIFTDTDDLFDSNRIELMIKALENEDIVFTDLVPVNVKGDIINQKSFLSNKEVITFDDIINKNIIGFSHTGVKWKHLSKVYPYQESLKVGDWWFFASLLDKGFDAKIVKNTVIYYRQHENNIAGMKKKYFKKDISFGLDVKIPHYQELLKFLSENNFLIIEDNLKNCLELKEKLFSDEKSEENMKVYLDNLNSNLKIFGWWEFIDLKYL